jgi:hypothetical protein
MAKGVGFTFRKKPKVKRKNRHSKNLSASQSPKKYKGQGR